MSDKHIADVLVSGGVGLLLGVIMTFAPNKWIAIGITVLVAVSLFAASWSVLRIDNDDPR